MAHTNTILRSINLDGGLICVDIFRRPDGTFGFEEYRREPEETRGWFAIGHHSHLSFGDESAALGEAKARVSWLADALA